MIRMFRRSSSPAVDDPRLVAVRRARLGLTQADLAEMMNLSPRNLTSIEEGRAPSDEMLKRLAAVLGVDRRTGRTAQPTKLLDYRRGQRAGRNRPARALVRPG